MLVSSSTAGLVETELTDLGEHRFKDLGAPERVFQLGAEEFPALKTLYRTNLPVPATPFLGREAELREVGALLADEATRLVTLTGPGGTGKTRLALQAAAEAADGFPDGVYWIPLAPLRDASLLDTTFAQSLEVSEQPGIAVADSIVGAFAGKRALLVVDNCEHLVDAVASLVRRLVEGCPTLVVAASSRERLGLRAERVYAVPADGTDGRRGALHGAGAGGRGRVRARRARRRHLRGGGRAAARYRARGRARALALDAGDPRAPRRAPRASSRPATATSRSASARSRRRSPGRTTCSTREEQRILRALSVFAGGCTLEAAEEVAGADLDLLESLLDKSLIRAPDRRGGPRPLLDARDDQGVCGASRLSRLRRVRRALRAHADCVRRARAARRSRSFRSLEKQFAGSVVSTPEQANFRAALERSKVTGQDSPDRASGTVCGSTGRDVTRSWKGRQWLETAMYLRRSGEPTMHREKLHWRLTSWMAFERGEYTRAMEHAEERLTVAQTNGRRDSLEARALGHAGRRRGGTRRRRARDHARSEARGRPQSHEHRRYHGYLPIALHNLGVVLRARR